MEKKGERTKKRIAAMSRTVFIKKGFSKVTMQDICDAAGMSRGGIYRHFSSTSEIFMFILNDEYEHAVTALRVAVARKITTDRIFDRFLKYRIEQIRNVEESIDNVTGEFIRVCPEGKAYMAKIVTGSVEIIERMIRLGEREGYFKLRDPKGVARNILWMLEGMSRHNAISRVTDEEVSSQLYLIDQMLGRAR